MSKMKRLLEKVQPILDELLDDGPGTRMELFIRLNNDPDDAIGFNDDPGAWSDFKHHIGFLRVQGMLEIVPFKKLTAPGTRELVFDLTEEGHEFVHSLRQ